jgi:hypothetical protein
VPAPRLPRPAALAAATLLALGLVGAAAGTAADAAAGGTAADAAAGTAAGVMADAAGAPSGHVVVLGVDGLEWSDVTAQTMPTLATLSGQGAVASLVTRTAGDTTCPADAWLTLGTGTRGTGGRSLATPRGSDPLSTAPQSSCASLPATPSARGPYTVPDYSSYRAASAFGGAPGAAAEPDFGALAAPVRKAGGCVAAAGPGALLAATDARGNVAEYLGPADALTAADLDACALTLVDLGGYLAAATSDGTRYPPPVSRAAVFSAVDARIAALLPQLPTDSALVVAGLDDADPAAPRLHALLATGQAADGTVFTPGALLRASATRTDGLVRTVDLTPTLLHWIGLTAGQIAAADPRPLDGTVIGLGGSALQGDGAAVLAATRLDTANVVYQHTNGAFVTWMLRAVLILVLAAAVAFPVAAKLRDVRARRVLLLALAACASVLGAVAPASFLAGLDDWPAAADPAQRLYGLTAALAVILGLVVLTVSRFGRLRARPLAPAGITALITLAIIVGDVSSGSRLQRQTPFGLSFTTADRFFGIGDSAIGIYCAAALIGTFFAAALVIHDRVLALLVVGLLGLLAVVVCGLPPWGDRPIGMIAPAAGLALIALLTARQRLAWWGLSIALAITCALGWVLDGAGLLPPKTALLFAVPLGIAACALGPLRAVPQATADNATDDASAAPAASVGGPVPLGMQDQRRSADEA